MEQQLFLAFLRYNFLHIYLYCEIISTFGIKCYTVNYLRLCVTLECLSPFPICNRKEIIHQTEEEHLPQLYIYINHTW